MSTTEKKLNTAETCSTSQCSTEKAAQKPADAERKVKVEEKNESTAKKEHGGSCCGG